jgi:hypothetical protein
MNPDAIESATQSLTTASHKLAEEMYKKASATSATGEGAAPEGKVPTAPRRTKKSSTLSSKNGTKIKSKI